MIKTKIFFLFLFFLPAFVIQGNEGNSSANLEIKINYGHAQPDGILTTALNKKILNNLKTNLPSNQLNYSYIEDKNFFAEENPCRSHHYLHLYLSQVRASLQIISSWSSDVSPPTVA